MTRTVAIQALVCVAMATAGPRGAREASPQSRFQPAMAFDRARGVAVLFGGMRLGAQLADTWIWDGSSWKAVEGAGPPGRSGHAMSFDERRQRVVLFGGFGAN